MHGRSKSKQFCTSYGTGSDSWDCSNTQVDTWIIWRSLPINDWKSTTFSKMFSAMPFYFIWSISFGKSSIWVWIVFFSFSFTSVCWNMLFESIIVGCSRSCTGGVADVNEFANFGVFTLELPSLSLYDSPTELFS